MKTKQYKYISISTDDAYPGVIFGHYDSSLKINLEIAKNMVDSRLDFTDGNSVYVLIDGANMLSTTKEARDYMTSLEGGLRGIIGGAFISESAVASVIFNLFLKINKPIIPSKFFTNKEDALNWLTQLNGSKI